MATPGRGIVSVDYAGEVVQAIWTKPKEPEERQVLEAGDNGMATCTWSDGSTYYSNVPNLVLKSREESKVKVRDGYPNAKIPPAAGGKKAKAKAKKKAKKKDADHTASSKEESYSTDGGSAADMDGFWEELDADDHPVVKSKAKAKKKAKKKAASAADPPVAKRPAAADAAADEPPKKKQDRY